MERDSNRYFIYGTLRMGEPNYDRFDLAHNSKFHGKDVIQGARMYDLGGYYPCVVLTGEPNDRVVGEIVEFTNADCEKTICRMELESGYIKTTIDSSHGPVSIFVFEAPPSSARLINSGDWVNHFKNP